MQKPKGIHNLIITNSILSLWFALNLVAAIDSGEVIIAGVQLLTLLTLVVAGPALLLRLSSVQALARTLCYLCSYVLSAFIILALSTTGLWSPSALYVLPGVALIVYMIGVRGYLNQDHVRLYYAHGKAHKSSVARWQETADATVCDKRAATT